jgi:hypothetical protein
MPPVTKKLKFMQFLDKIATIGLLSTLKNFSYMKLLSQRLVVCLIIIINSISVDAQKPATGKLPVTPEVKIRARSFY